MTDIAYTEIDGRNVYGDASKVAYPGRLIVPLGKSVQHTHAGISPDWYETELDGVPRYIGCMGDKYYVRQIYCTDQGLFAEYTTDIVHDYDTMPEKVFKAIHGDD